MNIPRKVLLVDDEIDLLELFGIVLERHAYEVLRASTGRQALTILESETPALVVLDVAMPEVTGLDILRAMRREPRFDATKIVILTAVPVLIEPGDAEQADMVLTKPITPRAFEEAIARLLGP